MPEKDNKNAKNIYIQENKLIMVNNYLYNTLP